MIGKYLDVKMVADALTLDVLRQHKPELWPDHDSYMAALLNPYLGFRQTKEIPGLIKEGLLDKTKIWQQAERICDLPQPRRQLEIKNLLGVGLSLPY